jgi:large subunit ribosomal protein L5
MRPFLEKVVVNICIGQSGETLQKAATVLEEMTHQKPCLVGAKRSIKEFGIRKGEKIAAVATLRGDEAKDLVNRIMVERDFKLLTGAFDNRGNMSLGIKEHINIPGMKYDPSTGIFGFDVAIRIVRKGYRVRTRKGIKSRIPRRQYVSKDEAILFMTEQFKAQVTDKIEVKYY